MGRRIGIADPTLEDLPTVPTAPVENHLADKICAMYEQHGRHGESPSTRYRDLADIVRIVRALPFEAARLAEILRREAGRRQLTLPHQIESPGNLWIQEYPKAARGFAEYPREFYTLDSSLSYAGRCLNEILNGSRATGSWDPDSQAWKA